MDIGANSIVSIIVGSTTDYLATFSPVFLLMGGIILSFVVLFALVSMLTGKKLRFDDDDIVDGD